MARFLSINNIRSMVEIADCCLMRLNCAPFTIGVLTELIASRIPVFPMTAVLPLKRSLKFNAISKLY